MIVDNLGMILQECNRSKAYLQRLIKSDLFPAYVVLVRDPNHGKSAQALNPPNLSNNLFDPYLSEEDSLRSASIRYDLAYGDSCDSPNAVDLVGKAAQEYFIFSGSGIIKNLFDAKKELIHVHPGKLPEYRGSTCPLYSALQEDRWQVTAFLIKRGIDSGNIILSKEFPLPPKCIDSTRIYDPYTRSEALADVVNKLYAEGKLESYPQDLSKGNDYYIIHPVLEYLVKEYFNRRGDK